MANKSNEIEVTQFVKENILFLNDTMVQLVAYAEIYKQNITKIEEGIEVFFLYSADWVCLAGDILSDVELATADTNQMRTLFNVTYELLGYINSALNGTTSSDLTNVLNEEESVVVIDANGKCFYWMVHDLHLGHSHSYNQARFCDAPLRHIF